MSPNIDILLARQPGTLFDVDQGGALVEMDRFSRFRYRLDKWFRSDVQQKIRDIITPIVQELDRENAELQRDRYKKWTGCLSGGLLTLLAGSGFMGSKLLSLMSNPGTTETLTTMLNATAGP